MPSKNLKSRQVPELSFRKRMVVHAVTLALAAGAVPVSAATYDMAYAGFALRSNAMASARMAAAILASESTDDADGYPLPPAMLTGSGGPTGGGLIPAASNAPKIDGTAAKLGYCAWDNGAATGATGRIAGALNLAVPALAVVAPGIDGAFNTTCADILAGVGTAGDGAKGDDFVVAYSTAQLRSLYSLHVGPAVANTAALTSISAASLRDGEIRLVKSDNTLKRWNAGTSTWVAAGSAGGTWEQDALLNLKAGKDALKNSGYAYNVAVGQNSLYSSLGGEGNIAIGLQTLEKSAYGINNIAIGLSTSRHMNDGSYNTAIGYYALQGASYSSSNNGAKNVAIGAMAMNSGSGGLTGNENVSVGYYSMRQITSGSNNVALGNYALAAINSGVGNVAIGDNTGLSYIDANSNTVNSSLVGHSYNTFLGYKSGLGSVGGHSYATAIGAGSRVSSSNTVVLGRTTDSTVIGAMAAIPADALLQVTGGLYLAPRAQPTTNLVAGLLNFNSADNMLYFHNGTAWVAAGGGGGGTWNPDINGNLKAGVGAYALGSTGTNNVAIGASVLAKNTSGSSNVALGSLAMASNVSGGNNVALGTEALWSTTTGSKNIGIGAYALYANTQGAKNIAIGESSLAENTIGGFNVAIGNQAAQLGLENTYLIAIGPKAALGMSSPMATPSDNIAIGRESMNGRTSFPTQNTGVQNIALGYKAMFGSENAPLVGSNNVAIGASALQDITSGAGNVALGALAGVTSTTANTNKTGSNNTFIGYDSGPGSTTQLTYATSLGAGARVTTNDTVVLGRSVDRVVMGGTGSVTYDATLQVTGGAYLAPRVNPAANLAAGLLNFNSADNKLYFYNGTGWVPAGGTWDADANDNLKAGSGAYASGTTGYSNLAAGYRALHFNTEGGDNVAIGYEALYSNTLGTSNLAFGYQALYQNTEGVQNFAAGASALRNNSTGANNVAIGASALFSNTTGGYNIAFGSDALYGNTTGSSNLAIGFSALAANDTGDDNIAIGRSVLNKNVNGAFNTGIGAFALEANTSGFENLAIGTSSLRSNLTGSNNTALGSYALEKNTSGKENVAIGTKALADNTTGIWNVAVGIHAGQTSGFTTANVTGSYNTYLGSDSGPGTVTQLDYATAIGAGSRVTTSDTIVLGRITDRVVMGGTGSVAYDATLQVTGGAYLVPRVNPATNLAAGLLNFNSGDNKLYYHSGTAWVPAGGTWDADALRNLKAGAGAYASGTTGADNVAAGYQALNRNTTGLANIALGNGALSANTVGSNNVAIGFEAAKNLAGRTQVDRTNIAIGAQALQGGDTVAANNTGFHNVALGYQAMMGSAGVPMTGTGNFAAGNKALRAIASGYDNTAIGDNALAGNTDGTENVAIGVYSLSSNTTGSRNVAIGDYTLSSITNGGFNIGIGSLAFQYATGGSSNIGIGRRAMEFNTTGAHNIAIGTATISNNSSGSHNLALGYSALQNNDTGNNNLAFGQYSLDQNYLGSENIALGKEALYGNQEGNYNIALGSLALRANGNSSNNVAIGYHALRATYAGGNNVALGHLAGYTSTPANANTTGTNNTFIGYDSGPGSSVQLNYATAIGAGSRVTTPDTIVLGRTTDITVIGDTAADTVSAGYGKLQVGGHITPTGDNTYNLGSGSKRWAVVYAANGTIQTSDARLKTNFATIDGGEAVKIVERMNPVRYNWSNPKDGYARKVGFVAQELAQVLPEVVHIPSMASSYYGVNYAEITAVLAAAVKKQQEVIGAFSVKTPAVDGKGIVLAINGMLEADVIEAQRIKAKEAEFEKLRAKEIDADKVRASKVTSGEAVVTTGTGCSPLFSMPLGSVYEVRAMSSMGGWGSMRIGLSATGPVVQDRKISDGPSGVELNIIGDQVCAISAMSQSVNASWLRVL